MEEDNIITGWLVRREGEQMITANMMEPGIKLRLPKLKQIMLNLAGEQCSRGLDEGKDL